MAKQGLLPPICDRVADWAIRHSAAEVTALFSPRTITRILPRTVESQIDDVYLSRRIANQGGRYLVPLDRARLVGPTGLIRLSDGSFSAESVYRRSNVLADPDYRVRTRRPQRACPGNYFSLLVVWARGRAYYHWLHDTLERLYGVMEHLPDDTKFIVPAELAPFQRETLRLVGIDEDRIAPYSGEEWELERLYFAPPATNSGSHRRDADAWLRDAILDAYGISSGSPDRRIFVSRRSQNERRVVNETALEEFLSGYGFETCVPEHLSFRQQVELFAEADVIVSTHGSAFTNMLFAPRGVKVVDMIEPGMIPWGYVFWAMAEELGHEYWYFVADAVSRPGHQNDTLVPIDKLASTFDSMGLGPSHICL